MASFNPTMVRLLRAILSFSSNQYTRFQSHNGAIAACIFYHPFICFLPFQSHNGAIAATLRRLIYALAPVFQSHNGAIAASMMKMP